MTMRRWAQYVLAATALGALVGWEASQGVAEPTRPVKGAGPLAAAAKPRLPRITVKKDGFQVEGLEPGRTYLVLAAREPRAGKNSMGVWFVSPRTGQTSLRVKTATDQTKEILLAGVDPIVKQAPSGGHHKCLPTEVCPFPPCPPDICQLVWPDGDDPTDPGHVRP